MPCRTYEPHEIQSQSNRQIQSLMKNANRLTQLLCTACSLLEETDLWEQLRSQDEYRHLDSWWEDHKKEDARKKMALQSKIRASENEIANIELRIKKLKKELEDA